MPIESIKMAECYLPSLALQRAWDNPKLAEWSEGEFCAPQSIRFWFCLTFIYSWSTEIFEGFYESRLYNSDCPLLTDLNVGSGNTQRLKCITICRIVISL